MGGCAFPGRASGRSGACARARATWTPGTLLRPFRYIGYRPCPRDPLFDQLVVGRTYGFGPLAGAGGLPAAIPAPKLPRRKACPRTRSCRTNRS